MSGRLVRVATFLVAVGALLGGSPGSLAQSPDAPQPSAAAPVTPAASPRPDPCAPMASLPAALDGRPLDVTLSEGVAAIDPDDLIDPLLADLGRTRADVCVATVEMGSGSVALAGQLLRIAGSDAGDLAPRLAMTLGDRLTGYGAQASVSPLDLEGTSVWSLDVVAEGQATRIIVGQVGDTLLISSDQAAMPFLATLLMAAAAPSPMPSVESPSPSG